MSALNHSRKAMFAFLSILLLSGCASYRVEGLFTQPALQTHRRHAMVGLSAEGQQILMAAYLDAFPGKDRTFLGTQKLQAQLSEEEVTSATLDDDKRVQIAETLEIDAIIFAYYQHREEATDKGGTRYFSKLLVRVVDMTTGEIAGSVIVTADTRSEPRLAVLARKAVAALRARVRAGTIEGGRRRSQIPPSERSRRRGIGAR